MNSMATAGETADNWKDSNRGREGQQPELQLPTDKQAKNRNGKTTTSAVCLCGKVCKNPHGLKIHQTKMKCLTGTQVVQRTGPVPSETQEEPGQESTHSAQTLHAPQVLPRFKHFEHRWVMWPAASKEREWLQFDEDLDQVLDATARGDADQKLLSMSAMIINIGAERFGIKEQQPARCSGEPNRRQLKISQLRQELRLLGRQFKVAREEEKAGLAELRSILRKRLITLRRAEWHRRRGRERARRRAAFIANPFGFTKKILGQKRSGHLACTEDEVNNYLNATYSDNARKEDLGPCRTLITTPAPTSAFNIKEPTLKEVEEVIKAARSNSTPGPSGVPYVVYKRCPRLLKRLWTILRVIWRRGKVAQQWRHAEGVWIPKEESSITIEQFRIISLLSVEGKIFFSIVARRLMEFLLRNTYIDTCVQKGGVPKVPGCIEHTGVVTQLIREARDGKGDLAVLWLDLANAYGSMPHKLVETSLDRHHVPGKIKDLILDYYSCFSLRVTSGTVTSAFHRLEKGIITGCTISVVLFSLAMNMLVKSAEVECRGPLTNSGMRQPPIRAFMDDLTVTTTSVPGCRWILQGLEHLIRWARMNFKPAKSRSLVVKKGKVSEKYRFSIEDTQIPSVGEKPVKSLGKIYDCTLRDTAALQATSEELGTWLRAVDKSGLPGKFKVWLYQHGILPRLLWPLLVYNVPITTVECFERKVSSFLRKWLGLPRSLSSIALYGRNNKLKLPFSSLTEEFMVTRAREVLLYRDSSDIKVSSAGIEVRTGRKWCAQEAVNQAESRLRHSELVGTVATGRAGLGSNPRPSYNKVKGKERRQLIQEEVRPGVEEVRCSRAVGMCQQGAWTRWEEADLWHKVMLYFAAAAGQ
ncbi:retrovirus-related Pol polyprotein from type-1 retrotransposable element R2 [Odontesthes bonariensis]|uniref:retrovirus-related Pol polyprotein from type-1 retrotransposable element R2 n=1 Tax=Odontesthes bonariensis TaxID=219752 RepID=UPI003F582782